MAGGELTDLRPGGAPARLSAWRCAILDICVISLQHSPGPASPHPATQPPVEDIRVSGHGLVRILTVLSRLEVLRLGQQTQDLESPDLLGLLASPAENIGTTAYVRHLHLSLGLG